MKGRLVQSHAERVRRIESGDLKVVGVNAFTETAPSPLADIAQRGGIVTIDHAVEQAQVDALEAWKRERDNEAVDLALERLRKAAITDENLVPATIELARVGGTVGEWSGALRDVFGEYRAPTGVGAVSVRPGEELEGVRDAGPGRGQRPPHPDPRRQARSRRPLERRRADRGRGPRRRHGGRLPGHPAHAGPDRGRRPGRGRRRRRTLDPVGLAPRRWCPKPSACSAKPGSPRPSSSAASSLTATAPSSNGTEWRGSTLPRTTDSAGIMSEVADLALAHRSASGKGFHPPMRNRMQDPRLVIAVTAGIAALTAGVIGVAADSAVLGVVAGAAGVLAATAGVALGRPRPPERRPPGPGRGGDPPGQARARLDQRRPRRRDEPPRRRSRARPDARRSPSGRRANTPSTPRPASTTSATSRCSSSNRLPPPAGRCDPCRSSIFEIDGMSDSDRETQVQALGVVGEVRAPHAPRERRRVPPR